MSTDTQHIARPDGTFIDAGNNIAVEQVIVSDFDDRMILCIDCTLEFVWSAGEQEFFRDKGLTNPPKRCKDCKKAKNERIEAVANALATGKPQKIEVRVDCARCGKSTTVPFYPSQGRPVFCRSCFIDMNAASTIG